MDNFDLKKYLAEGKLLKENQLMDDILGNQAEVEKQLDTKLKDFKIAGDDRVLRQLILKNLLFMLLNMQMKQEKILNRMKAMILKLSQLIEKK